MEINKAKLENLSEIKEIFINASKHMKEEKNFKQWEVIDDEFVKSLEKYIENNEGYIVKSNDEIVGFFALIYGEDKTYKVIKNGKWLNDDPYVTIHKIAVKYFEKHIGTYILKYIENKIKLENIFNIRIDTHINNISMNIFLNKNYFVKCGTISLNNSFNDIDNLREAFIKTLK